MPIALIDSNNFYAACEQSIDPSIINRPLVILSNNDGCIIARNAEAKALGISMGLPYFIARNKLNKLDIEVRSSNYALYADMSQRLMSLIKENCEAIEIYSIDEAFVKVSSNSCNLNHWARQLRETIYQSLGLPIAIGIGTTKSQSKLANHLAKTTACHAGIFNICNISEQDKWLEKVAIEKVWGIGKKLAYWCRLQGIRNARQLRDTPSNILKKKAGIEGIRLQRELQGKECFILSITSKPKKETCVSRSFSRPITRIEELRHAIAIHVICASEKLRSQKQYAAKITIFTRTSLYTSTFYSQSATHYLNIPTNNSKILLSETLRLTDQIFHPNYLLMKAGVIMQNLLSEEYLQLHLFSKRQPKEITKQERLMETIDQLNKHYGRNTVQWGLCGLNYAHQNLQKYSNSSATTCLKDIPIVIA